MVLDSKIIPATALGIICDVVNQTQVSFMNGRHPTHSTMARAPPHYSF